VSLSGSSPFSVDSVSLYYGEVKEFPLTPRFWRGVGLIARERGLSPVYGHFQSASNWYLDLVELSILTLPDFVVSDPYLLSSFELGYGLKSDCRYSSIGKAESFSFPFDPVLVSLPLSSRVPAPLRVHVLSHMYSLGDPGDVIQEGVSQFGLSPISFDPDYVSSVEHFSYAVYLDHGNVYVSEKDPFPPQKDGFPSYFLGYGFC